ncbi:hypothetical protein ACFLIM_14825 [Nonomuraea sp. M3C6]|uniref:Uncharacterized protein n=1 Tax=Nonomuraea marmarensis TaxID=3351344 RepID=A0ABW7AAU6_9ACTN
MPAGQTAPAQRHHSAAWSDIPPPPEELETLGPPSMAPPPLTWSHLAEMLVYGIRERTGDGLGFAGFLALAEENGLLELRPNTWPDPSRGGTLMVHTQTSEVRQSGLWVNTLDPGNAVAARQLARSKNVHVCELANPEQVAEVSALTWAKFLSLVRENTYQPDMYGNLVMFTIDEPYTTPKPIITTLVNWQVFTYAVTRGHFDKLPPVEIGLDRGKWLTAETIV